MRHKFARYLIVDLGLDVAQVRRILGHVHVTTTLSVYTHLLGQARHADELRVKMTASAFASLLEPAPAESHQADVIAPPSHGPATVKLPARKRAGLRWAT